MENSKTYVFLGIALAIFAFSLIFFLASRGTGFAPSDTELEECKTLQFEGNGKIGILFFGERKEVQEWSDSFFSVSPFEENQDAFNIYYIDSYQPECEEYGGGIAFVCHSRELIAKAASCPDVEHIAVLKRDSTRVRSSSYLNVMSINTIHPKSVLLHEFGHNFADFDEEYINGQRPRGANCEQTCDSFENVEECFQGCSRDDYQRTIDNGIMRTLSPENPENPYGDFNANYIQELIERRVPDLSPSITGNAVDEMRDCSEESFVLSEFNVQTKQIETYEFTGCIIGNGAEGDFTFSIISGEQEIYSEMFSSRFFTDAFITSEESLSGDTYESENVGKILLSSSVDLEGDKQVIRDSEGNIIAEGEIYSKGARLCEA